jgi:hypothetical protein
MQPIRICLGMKPTIYPKPNVPMRKNTRPVSKDESAYEVIVVAITASAFSSPTLAMIVNAILWKKGTTSICDQVSMSAW